MKKFAFIGAGSLDFTKDLVRDILTFEAFRDAELYLMDINPTRLEYAIKGVQKIIDAGHYPATVKGTLDRREALKDADGVLITILQGGVEVWRYDIEIPKKYGVDICVGDTRGPSGIFRFLRTAPVMLDIIRDAEEVCPNAIVLNYTNPMDMLVSFLQSKSKMNITGLCHSVQGTAEMLAGWLNASDKKIEYTCAGINHQAFYLDFKVDGKDAYPDLLEAIKREEVANEEPVRIEMFKRLGYFNTESSGHNSEYLPWFRKRKDLIEKYCTHGTGWNPGAYAYILDEYLGREDTWEKEYQDWLDNAEVDLSRGEEYASNIFNAIFGDNTPYYFNANLKNKNYITNIKQGCCVEVPVVADKNGITSTGSVTLPDHLAVMVNNSALIEELAVNGAIAGDPNMIFQAILFDPLTSAVLSMEEIQNMVQEMFDKNADYLTYFKSLKIDMRRVHEKDN
ncbi:MAG: alpha-galactosidase [Erysipelotrichaceae bacterium]|nr:alpha-galactosidase [Erysipelotrichaceae bacterium]